MSEMTHACPRFCSATALGAISVFLSWQPSSAQAQGELMTVDFQAAPPYAMTWSGGSRVLAELGSVGPKAAGNLWQHTHHPDGGWNGRAFVRYAWWDWDVSGVGHDADQAGWTESASRFRPAGGWSGQGPYYLRFRIRVAAPILPYSTSSSCDDTQMKFFLWNNFTSEGTDRVIMYLHAGNEYGGNDLNETTIRLGAGVSGSFAATHFPNGQWVHVQLAWRWGSEATGYQRIYVDTNDLSRPTAENRVFDDLDTHQVDTWGPLGGPTGLDDQFFWGGITNSGSCVAEDALLDIMDLELATEFDPSWFPNGGVPTTPAAPSNLRLVLP